MQALEDEVLAWSDSSPYQLTEKRNADTTVISIFVNVLREPNLTRWSLIAGDAVHNIRTALDHLVYEIASSESGLTPPPNGRELEFPITDKPEWFARRLWRIESLSCAVRTRIESVQPYNRLRDDIPPVLSSIRDLDDEDKHRLLAVTFAQPDEGSLRYVSGLSADHGVDSDFHTGAVVDGTNICTLFFDRPAPDVHYEFRASLVISVGHTWGPLGENRFRLTDVLRGMLREAAGITGYLRGGPLPPL